MGVKIQVNYRERRGCTTVYTAECLVVVLLVYYIVISPPLSLL